ncbi:MAG TPA: ROK family transcriptional regulator [Solirubrobacteraceae bacterium]|nr:ROK family transcriptional regulator [Solirubrobacteraceae bacterium]
MATHDPTRAPANQRSVRRHNLGVVLRHVADHGPRSRAAIAQETGLNKTTVSSLVGELIEFGLVRETEVEMRGTVGRPALPVELSGRRVVGLGLELGVDFLAVRAADLTGDARHQELVTVDNRGRRVDDVLDDLARMASDALAAVREQDLLPAGAVVALPGLVDSDGRLLVAPNLGWTGVSVPELLAERLGRPPFPIQAENEANLGALAELWEGAGREFSDFIYVSGELGVGAGIIIGGELFRGAHGFGGELGHTTVEPEGERCACGNRGCLETRVALGALLHAAGLDPGARVGELAERAEDGDERVLRTLADAGRWLGIAVASAANLLNPRGVVVGGYFATLVPWLLPGLRQELDAHVLAAEWDAPRVVTSALGAEAAVRGASALALRRVFADPGLVAYLRRR